jgi:NitT/TauT family transport system ATP-binding protein
VLSNRPAQLRAVIDINLPRPRHYQVMSSPEAFEYKREAMELLHDEAMRSFRPFQARQSPGPV